MVVRGLVRRVVRGVVRRVVRGVGSVGSPRSGGQFFQLSRPHRQQLRQDKIVVYFTVYFCGCMFGSLGLFSPCLIEDLFAHKDFKRALFSK